MKHVRTSNKGFFKPVLQSKNVQAATMVLKPGQTSSDQPENEHPMAEQWLFVISGVGRARVGNRTIHLRPGSLLLIEKKERHQITGGGTKPLVTLNFYAPPVYANDGSLKHSKGGSQL